MARLVVFSSVRLPPIKNPEVPTSHRSNRRLLSLFLFTVLLPCAVLLSIALHTMQRERQFVMMRAAEDRARAAEDVKGLLLSRLDATRDLAMAAPGRPANNRARAFEDSVIQLVAPVVNGELLLAWEKHRGGARPGTPFHEALRSAETAEFTQQDANTASTLYAAALQHAETPTEAAAARIALARSLAHAGRPADAKKEYTRVARIPFDVTDEHGVPFWAYGAAYLLALSPEASVGWFVPQVYSACCVSAEGWYMVRAILDSALKLPGSGMQEVRATQAARAFANSRARAEDQAGKLKEEIAARRLTGLDSLDGAWMLWGSAPWFVSLARDKSGGEAVVIAIDAASGLKDMNKSVSQSVAVPINLRLTTQRDGASGKTLSPEFPGILATFGPGAGAGQILTTPFFMGLLLLVICVTLFGAYAVWYDVRRELRLSEMRSHFVASVSHELKTPLTSIRMFAETLQMGRSQNAQTDAEYLRNIVNETERLTRLLNNVLDVSKIDRGEKIYHFTPISLADVVMRCTQTMEYPLEQEGLRLNVSSDVSVPPLVADGDAIQQAILNLIANAMKYANGSHDIDLTLTRLNGDAVVKVRDRGTGIAAEHLARIKEKFYRAPTAENARISGTGLGLTLVDHIVNAHGGRLTIDSTIGKGSTVAIHLPIVTPE